MNFKKKYLRNVTILWTIYFTIGCNSQYYIGSTEDVGFAAAIYTNIHNEDKKYNPIYSDYIACIKNNLYEIAKNDTGIAIKSWNIGKIIPIYSTPIHDSKKQIHLTSYKMQNPDELNPDQKILPGFALFEINRRILDKKCQIGSEIVAYVSDEDIVYMHNITKNIGTVLSYPIYNFGSTEYLNNSGLELIYTSDYPNSWTCLIDSRVKTSDRKYLCSQRLSQKKGGK